MVESGQPPEWIPLAEAAERLGISVAQVRARIASGQLPVRRVSASRGPRVLVRLTDTRFEDRSVNGQPPQDAPSPAVQPAGSPAEPPRLPVLSVDAARDLDVTPAPEAPVPPALREMLALIRDQQDQIAQLAAQVGRAQAQLERHNQAGRQSATAHTRSPAGGRGGLGTYAGPNARRTSRSVGRAAIQEINSRSARDNSSASRHDLAAYQAEIDHLRSLRARVERVVTDMEEVLFRSASGEQSGQ